MSEDCGVDPKALHAGGDDLPELELADEDILDAMQHIPGFLDISTADFREIYHLAHRHALARLFGRVRAGRLMRTGIEPLRPDMLLEEAIAVMARQGLKALPVVDESRRVVGILTQSDLLRQLEAGNFLELLLRLMKDPGDFRHRCHETAVREAMCATPVTVREDAGFFTIVRLFHGHEGRSMPVVDEDGRLRGLLLEGDFISACHLEDLL